MSLVIKLLEMILRERLMTASSGDDHHSKFDWTPKLDQKGATVSPVRTLIPQVLFAGDNSEQTKGLRGLRSHSRYKTHTGHSDVVQFRRST